MHCTDYFSTPVDDKQNEKSFTSMAKDIVIVLLLSDGCVCACVRVRVCLWAWVRERIDTLCVFLYLFTQGIKRIAVFITSDKIRMLPLTLTHCLRGSSSCVEKETKKKVYEMFVMFNSSYQCSCLYSVSRGKPEEKPLLYLKNISKAKRKLRK